MNKIDNEICGFKIFLTLEEKRKNIVIGSKTNYGIVECITAHGNWVVVKENKTINGKEICGQVVGEFRDVMEIDGGFYFI